MDQFLPKRIFLIPYCKNWRIVLTMISFVIMSNVIYSQALCNGARSMSCPFTENFGTYNEADNVDRYCNGNNTGFTGDEVVYRFTPSTSGTYRFELSNVENNKDLDMFLLSSCNSNSCIANSDGSSSNASDIISTSLSANTTYYVVVDTDESAGGSESNYTIRVSGCSNDDGDDGGNTDLCREARRIPCNVRLCCETTSGSGNDFTVNNTEYSDCRDVGSNTYNGLDKVYEFVKTNSSDVVTVEIDHSQNINLTMFILDRCDASRRECIGTGTNTNPSDPDGEIWTDEGRLPAGTYYVVVDGAGSSVQGSFSIEVKCEPRSDGGNTDLCKDARRIPCNDRLCCETTSGGGNNFTVNNTSYADCRNVGSNSYNGPDIVYEFTKTSSSDVVTVEMDHSQSINLTLFILDRCGVGVTPNQPSIVTGPRCIGTGTNTNPSDPDGEIWTDEGKLAAGTYYIVVDGASSSVQGSFSLEVRCERPSTGLDCTRTRPMSCPFDERFGTYNESNNVNAYCNGSNTGFTGDEVVYEFRPTKTGEYTFSLSEVESGKDLDLFILSSCDANSCIADTDASSNSASDNVTASLTSGRTYYVVVDTDESGGGSESNYRVKVECPTEDLCKDARRIPCNERLCCETTTGGGNDFSVNNTSYSDCRNVGSNSYNGPDKVYTFTKEHDDDVVEVEMDHSQSINLTLFILDQCDESRMECIGTGTNTNLTDPDGEIWTDEGRLSAGTYYIVVDGASSSVQGSFSIEVRCERPPTGLDCTRTRTMSCPFDERYGTYNESNDVDAYCNNNNRGFTGNEVVYEFRPSKTGEYRFSLSELEQGRDLDIFILSSCDANRCLANTDGSSSSSADDVSVNLTSGRTYYVVVDTDESNGGRESNYRIKVECPTEDLCKDVRRIPCNERLCCETTVGGGDNFSVSNTSYSDCRNVGTNPYSGPDKVYEFVKTSSSDVITIEMDHSQSINLTLFILDRCDASRRDCIGTGSNTNPSDPDGEIWTDEGSLPAGTYYIVVDGASSSVQGSYSIEVRCEKRNSEDCKDCCDNTHTRDALIEDAKRRCADANNVSIFQCTYNGRCVYNVVTVPYPAIVSNLDIQYVQEQRGRGRVIDCEGRSLFSYDYDSALNVEFFAERLENCKLIWTCEGDYCEDDCFESCCHDQTWLNRFISSSEAECSEEFGARNLIERSRWRGRCVYVVSDLSLVDFPSFVYDCEGNVLFSFGGFTAGPTEGDRLAEELESTSTIWTCENRRDICNDNCYDRSLEESYFTISCSFEFDPVCGCDGKTYRNNCIAESNGYRSVPGPCLNDCVVEELIEPNAFCPLNIDPVCGCDGNTYQNECRAQNAGVTSWTRGECHNAGSGCSFPPDPHKAVAGLTNEYNCNAIITNSVIEGCDWNGRCVFKITQTDDLGLINGGVVLDQDSYDVLFTFSYTTNLNIDGFVNTFKDCRVIWDCRNGFSLQSGENRSIQNEIAEVSTENIEVFPNPFTDQVNITLNALVDQSSTFQVYSLDGKSVIQQSLDLIEGENSFQIDMGTEINAGYYIYRIVIDGELFSDKILKLY